ncbi:MAG: ABC transporter ATP-binding protein, partial [Lysobacterales bacterium]
MNDDVTIRADQLGKSYQLYERPRDRLLQAVFRGRRQYYHEFWALRDITFELRRGQTMGVVGKNGAGKSTLLQLVCGTLSPTVGSVSVHGRVAAILELGSGFNPEFTGRENVYLNGSILGMSQGEIDRKFDDIASFADIGDFIGRPVKTYSSGMFVRLAFAVIANADADVLVIDEALAVGDAYFAQKCMRFLRLFRERGTILFVSHDTGTVVNLCHRAMWLHKGGMQELGGAKQVCDSYLRALIESEQGPSPIASPLPESESVERIDGRTPNPLMGNHLELGPFDSGAPSFGKLGARVTDVRLEDDAGRAFAWLDGGESATLVIRALAQETLSNLLVGFYVKDRLGQTLFGENTFLTYVQRPVTVLCDTYFEARFEFQMPILPAGDYSICVSVAEGTQVEHIQHHWIHDALVFRSHSSSVSSGLVGIPMRRIELSP